MNRIALPVAAPVERPGPLGRVAVASIFLSGASIVGGAPEWLPVFLDSALMLDGSTRSLAKLILLSGVAITLIFAAAILLATVPRNSTRARAFAEVAFSLVSIYLLVRVANGVLWVFSFRHPSPESPYEHAIYISHVLSLILTLPLLLIVALIFRNIGATQGHKPLARVGFIGLLACACLQAIVAACDLFLFTHAGSLPSFDDWMLFRQRVSVLTIVLTALVFAAAAVLAFSATIIGNTSKPPLRSSP